MFGLISPLIEEYARENRGVIVTQGTAIPTPSQSRSESKQLENLLEAVGKSTVLYTALCDVLV